MGTEHAWLYRHRLDNTATLRRLIAFYVRAHDETMPHAAFNGQTPDEMYFGNGDAVVIDLAVARVWARRERIKANRTAACGVCARDPDSGALQFQRAECRMSSNAAGRATEDPALEGMRMAVALRTAVVAALAAAVVAAGEAPVERRWDFDSDVLDSLPEDWVAPVGRWSVASDESAPSGERVLAQRGRSWLSTFNVALVEGSSLGDLDLVVKLRAVSGRIDQGGGPVWRAADEGNYYVARWNPLESNYRVYFVKDGKRQQLRSADVTVDLERWHTLRITMEGDHIQGYLDGKKYLDVRDSTFAQAGRVGLWTKADAKTHFDDLTIRGAPSEASLDPQLIGPAAGTEATRQANAWSASAGRESRSP